jgi:hypothetical protein
MIGLERLCSGALLDGVSMRITRLLVCSFIMHHVPVPLGCWVVMVVCGLSVVGRIVVTAAGITGSVLMAAQRVPQTGSAR